MPNFLFGITGSISLYKSLSVLSKLKKSGFPTSVVMTPMATKFVTELTFASFTDGRTYSNWNSANPILHIDLAKWADVFVVAPASVNTISASANGIADNLLLSTILAYDKNIYFVPAMNTKMYNNPFVQENIEKLKRMGHIVIEPEIGMLACGDTGKGRYPDPDLLFDYIVDINEKRDSLLGKKILISAGPTKEDIDPVRYITNRSSGKMGYSLASEAVKRNADVTLVSGEVNLSPPIGVKKFIKVRSSDDFYNEIKNIYKDYDIIIMAAAIADFTPTNKANEKIKKNDEGIILSLRRTVDVLKYLGENKRDNQFLVGFAAETNSLIKNAESKLKKKNLDLIIANDVSKSTTGFQSDTNAATLMYKNGKIEEIGLCTKRELAKEIFDSIVKKLKRG